MSPHAGLQERYERIVDRLRAATDRPVTLIAVSKTHASSAIEALYHLGHRDFGENYAQEILEKAPELERRGCTGIRWHFIGHLQTNKVKQIIPYVHAVHSVDSLKLAGELAKRWRASGRTGRLEVFLEVNIDREASKSGLNPDEVSPTALRIADEYPELSLSGLMAIPSPANSDGKAFRDLRKILENCREGSPSLSSMTQLSMGMTQDFECALREGATHVRVGTAIFGSRGK